MVDKRIVRKVIQEAKARVRIIRDLEHLDWALEALDPEARVTLLQGQEAREVLEYLGLPEEDIAEFPMVFVVAYDGDYEAVWGARGRMPYELSWAYLLK